jgi:hypothetical protein
MSSLYWAPRYSAYLKLESQNLTRNPSPQQLWNEQCTLYTEHCVQFWDSCFEQAEYIKLKIQRHLFADLTLTHL